MAKLNELGFELLPHPPYSPDLAPSDYWLFADLKKMLRGSESEAEDLMYPDSDLSLTMSTYTISPIPPGVNDDSKFMNVMTWFAEFAAKRASNTSFDHSMSNSDKEFQADLDRFPAIAAGFNFIAPKTSSSVYTIPTDMSAPGWISQSAADCERSDKLKRFRNKKMLDTPYSRLSLILLILHLRVPKLCLLLTLLALSYAGHGNSFALLSPDDNEEAMDVVPPGQPSDVGSSGCDVSHPQDAPCAEKNPRTQVTSSRPSSRPPPFIIAGFTSLRDIANLA
ncbi:hypothetical protein ACLKA7_001005 [Drosophila subpalustris]